MNLIDKAYLLKRTRLFESLDLDELLPIADKLSQAHFDAGKVIFSKNDQALRMFFIAKGSVELEAGSVVTTLDAIDFFGDESIFSNEPRAYTARSKTETVLLSISRTNLMTIISECPSVAVGLLHVYSLAMPLRLRP